MGADGLRGREVQRLQGKNVELTRKYYVKKIPKVVGNPPILTD